MNKLDAFSNELKWIQNANIHEFAEKAINNLPDYFFKVAASSTGKYHPEYALGNGGLVRHTKAALKIAYDLLSLEMFDKKFSSEDKDLILLAIMLHDGKKHGNDNSKYTVVEHPLLAVDFVKETNITANILSNEQENKVCNMIATHMGQWNTDRYKNEIMPKPKNSYQQFVHLCDYLASRKYLLFDFGDDYYNPTE